MTDYTHYERFMTRDELALRLNMETALRECCESECAKLKKELEALEEKVFTLNDKYRELEKEKANVEIEAKLKLDSNLTLLKGANANASALSLENEKLKRQVAELRELNKCLNDEVNKLKNDYYGVLNKYDDLSKDYNELKKQKEDLNADITKKVLDNIELNEQIEKDIQDYNKLFHEKERLEKDLEDANKRATPLTQPINIENLNITYYANGPIWTNDNDSDEEETANILVGKGEE